MRDDYTYEFDVQKQYLLYVAPPVGPWFGNDWWLPMTPVINIPVTGASRSWDPLVRCPPNSSIILKYIGTHPPRWWQGWPANRWHSFGNDGWGLCTANMLPGDVMDYYFVGVDGLRIGSIEVPSMIAPLRVNHDIYVWAAAPTTSISRGLPTIRLIGDITTRQDFYEERRAHR